MVRIVLISRFSTLRGTGLYHQADAPRRMSRCVHDAGREVAPANAISLADEIANVGFCGSGNPQPLGLHVEMAVEFEIVLVNQNGRSGGAVKAGKASDVVDVRVGAENRAHF